MNEKNRNISQINTSLRTDITLRPELRLSLQQVLFIELLPLNQIELMMEINHRIETNPLVEKDEIENLQKEEELKNKNADETDNILDIREADIEQLSSQIDIDWSEVIDDYLSRDLYKYKKGNDFDYPLKIATTQVCLSDILMLQLHTTIKNKDEIEIGERIIEYLNSDGYLEIHVADLATILKKTIYQIEKVLKIIQKFDPPGVAARNLEECILLQLRAKNYSDNSLPVKLIVNNGLIALKNKDRKKLRKILQTTDKKIDETVEIIKQLNPRPSCGNWGEIPRSVKPDFIIRESKGSLVLSSLWRNIEIPKVRINLSRKVYHNILKNLENKKNQKEINKKMINELKSNYQEAVFLENLSKHINDREYALEKVVKKIIEIQAAFLLEKEPLKPLTYKEVAEELDLNPSTVGRVVQNKFIETPVGTYSLRKFFSSAILTDNNGSVSSVEIREKIKEIIQSEDPLSPLTDEEISNILKEMGYNVARRTVAKYRTTEGIPTSGRRKEL